MTSRIDKINQLLQEQLARIIQEDFEGKFITVTAVETTLDLKEARVWISIFNEKEDILSQVNSKASKYQTFLGKKLFIKNIPHLDFRLDKSSKRVAKIDHILSKIK